MGQKENIESLSKELDQSKIALDQYNKGLSIFIQITAMTEASPREQVEEAINLTCKSLGYDYGVLSSVQDEDYYIEYVSGSDKLQKHQYFKLGNTFCVIPYKNEEVAVIENITDSYFKDHPARSSFPAESYIGVPLTVNDEKRGTISFFTLKPRSVPFDPNELDFIQILSNWISMLYQKEEYQKKVIEEQTALEEAREAMEIAEQANKAKEQFLSTMSHEIRTPLNAILGMTDLMLGEDQNEEQLKRLKLLKFSGQNLLALINDILDFNKIESGNLEIEDTDFDIKSLLDKIINLLFPLADQKGLEFFFQV